MLPSPNSTVIDTMGLIVTPVPGDGVESVKLAMAPAVTAAAGPVIVTSGWLIA